jgi:hypothetical protein
MDAVIPDIARSICLTYLTPRLWELAEIELGRPDPTRFQEAFEFCEAIPEFKKELREACYGGFGKDFVVIAGGRDIRDVASYSDTEFSRAIEWCMTAPTSQGENACVADSVSSVFWGGENDPNASFRFCGLVVEELSQGACYERLASAISSYVQDKSVRGALCERLPEQYRMSCVSDGA